MAKRSWETDKQLLKDLLYDLRDHHGYKILREWNLGVLEAMNEKARKCPHCPDGMLEMITDNSTDEVVVYDKCNTCHYEEGK